MKNYVCIISLFLYMMTSSAIAGVRGYYLFVWGGDFGRQYFKKYISDRREYKSNKSCWSERAGDSLAVIYINTYPAGVTDVLINSFLSGDNKSAINIRKSLIEFSDDMVSHGFDGMIIVNKKGNSVEIGTVPVKGKQYLYKRNFIINSDDYSLFDKQLCEALAPIDNYFSP